ncbi:leader peptidase (prepilin peptidase)/N-methyltransferase [Blastococcus colisei]|uniref:Leader peptidase (Prepilin peptidase)/N-methyltransferase n=1 Tax=Blastococcus colisei TaxID=1564162 RepID=A0A543PHN7_9ACTN|nr:A24 family peptidase [Blastococcus colisei]TQN43601.1 leader peptidase (prepilin peptidase)/N-methyltransferase [Blastococcus colisei]
MTAVTALVAGALGLLVGRFLNGAAGRFSWPPRLRLRRPGGDAATTPLAVPPPVLEGGTALLFALVALRFGLSWALPAFLFLAAVGVLLAVIDLQHRLLPNRVIVPSVGIGAGLLFLAAAFDHDWDPLLRAGLGAVVLFAVFLVLALISPGGLGMGDVKLAGLLGLYLGWLGWAVLAVGAAAGFVVQAALALTLLAARRIGLRGELPFGPALLVGAVLAIGWSDALLG